MFDSRFNYTFVYYHLRNHFETLTLPARSAESVVLEQGQLIRAINRLSATVSIPASQIDETVESLLQETFGKPPVMTPDGFYADLSDLPIIRDDLYELTVLGRLERWLREYIVDCLRNHLINVDDYVDEQEKDHNDRAETLWSDYQDEYDDFEEGDLGYDYDGPIFPESPSIMPFDRKAAIAERQYELSQMDLSDPAAVLDAVPIQEGLLGDMLHEHFENCEYIDEVISALDFTGLNKTQITHFLRTLYVYFPDTNIQERGFLAEILVDNIQHEFSKKRSSVDIDTYIGELFCALENDPGGEALLESYNEAAAENDDLTLQRLWFYLSQLSNALVQQLYSLGLADRVRLAEAIKNRYTTLQKEQGSTLKALIKVFPTDKVDNLYYPATGENKRHFPSHDVQLPLKPIFHTLEFIARESHAALKKHAGEKSNVGKTNVVSAMLSFVVSVQSDEVVQSSGYPAMTRFINVPVNFKYDSEIVSFDEAFLNADDIERSIGGDLELGARVAHRPLTLTEDRSTEAKQEMIRLIETLGIAHDKKQEMLFQISQAEVSEPVTLEYLTASDIMKSTEHRHSERVLNRALKKPENVAEIIATLRKSIHELGVGMGTYTIHSGALFVYSYPNSICDACSISFLALQNSYEKGFLANFIDAANAKDEASPIQFRTRGFNERERRQDPSEFGITVIAGSDEVFSKDAYAKLVANRPEAKFTCRQMPYALSSAGINLFSSASRGNTFFEYTADSDLHTDDAISIPYYGPLFMSGSKQSKLTPTKASKFETDVATIRQKTL